MVQFIKYRRIFSSFLSLFYPLYPSLHFSISFIVIVMPIIWSVLGLITLGSKNGLELNEWEHCYQRQMASHGGEPKDRK